MQVRNALIIFRRELRDQLRDRRTIFMIFVLPVLLYPMLGFSVTKLAEAFGKKPRVVIVVGAEALPAEPPLLSRDRREFAKELFEVADEAGLYEVRTLPPGDPRRSPERRRDLLRSGAADVVLVIPPGVEADLEKESRSVRFEIVSDSADEKSRDTARAVREVLDNWKSRIVEKRLVRDAKPKDYLEPVQAKGVDIASREESSGSIWGKLFPFLLVMMSLTGAFYPAVDLCAGEKERGTMETLLISPASRGEIVLGKFLTVMIFSIGTALLNLAGMAITGLQLARGLQAASAEGGDRPALAFSGPSLESIGWMILILIPLSVFFSALCLALAVMARSMKEGQYYMTPLYLGVMPLVFATLAPGIELDLFTSLVPITGVSLLLRALMLKDYAAAGRYFLPVLLPLVLYGILSLRWAVEQFRKESVLFRESERFDLRDWARHLIRDRGRTPTSGEALLCFAVMLSAAWMSFGFISASPQGMAIGQIGFILLPPVLMALLLTSSPRETLRLRWPRPRYILLAIGLALAINPAAGELRVVVEGLFPIPEVVKVQLAKLTSRIPDYGTALLVLAVIPAICEEVAFRGFILSGLERDFRPWSAILISAFLFGFLHVLVSLFQQLFNATLLGIVIGLLAVRSRSLVPGIVFHAINNSLAILMGVIASGEFGGWAPAVFRDPAQALYHRGIVITGTLIAIALLAWLIRDRGASKARRDEEPLVARESTPAA